MEDFNQIAPEWDNSKRTQRANKIAAAIRACIGGCQNKSALDYGCGTGLIGLQFVNEFASLVFMDSAPGMCEQVQKKLAAMQVPASRVICHDLCGQEAFQEQQFDVIFTSLTLHHIGDTKEILSRFFHLLRKDGQLLIVDVDKEDGSFHAMHPGFTGHNGFEQATLQALAAEVGFTEVTVNTFYQDTKLVHDKHVPYSLFILDAKRR